MAEYRVPYQNGEMELSLELLNQISEDVIAQVNSSEEMEIVLSKQLIEQYARKEAWKRAYKEIPLPSGTISLEARREMQERRNDLAEWYYLDIIEKYQ